MVPLGRRLLWRSGSGIRRRGPHGHGRFGLHPSRLSHLYGHRMVGLRLPGLRGRLKKRICFVVARCRSGGDRTCILGRAGAQRRGFVHAPPFELHHFPGRHLGTLRKAVAVVQTLYRQAVLPGDIGHQLVGAYPVPTGYRFTALFSGRGVRFFQVGQHAGRVVRKRVIAPQRQGMGSRPVSAMVYLLFNASYPAHGQRG